MFTFHKPRTYRSAEGCCICGAKSSSSRFTDSRKYERDTMQCFDLKQPRQGEICNACVLLVKRYKRLPVGSKKTWGHVVDARAGSNGNKVTVKYKSERISARVNSSNANNSNSVAISKCGNGDSINGCTNNNSAASNFTPEKFTKIYKKNKKTKDATTATTTNKRKANSCPQNVSTSTLTPSTDLLDSDYEDSRLQGALANTVVEFQTQTRASTHKAAAAAAAAAYARKQRRIVVGSKRRKLLMPVKNRKLTANEETVPFLDATDWKEKKSCCGTIYECSELGGIAIMDVDQYKPCQLHYPSTTATTIVTVTSEPIVALPPQTTNATLPTVVQLISSAASTVSSSTTVKLTPTSSCLSSSLVASANAPAALKANTSNQKPTPVLKKHHLFYKRQSEAFPQIDVVINDNPAGITQQAPTPVSTSMLANKTVYDSTSHQLNQTIIRTSINLNENLQVNGMKNVNNNKSSNSSGPLSISVSMPQMPRHSSAKVTTISAPTISNQTIAGNTRNNNTNNVLPYNKSQNFMHKIKTDTTGKIMKHSPEKLTSAIRLKPADLQEMKSIVKTVDKSYILANNKSTTATATATATFTSNSTASGTSQVYHPPLNGQYVTQAVSTTAMSSPSPTSSTSSTSSTKFSDNSSDSGFDENLMDRKSASPLQEDTDRKLLTRSGVHTMFLSSGVHIQGQAQNLVLTGNEVAAKILHNRKQKSFAAIPYNSTMRSSNINTASVKLAQITTAMPSHTTALVPSTQMSAAAQAKIRAIYNNSNTIQHENGITTIVPASSLAATTQTAAMNSIQPNTVTITPALPSNLPQSITRKYAANAIINLQNHNLILPAGAGPAQLRAASHANLKSVTPVGTIANIASHTIHAGNSHQVTGPNQKIILLKTPVNAAQVAAANAHARYNSRNIVVGGNGGACIGKRSKT